MKETQIIELGLSEPKEIVVEERDWLLGGETFNWDIRVEPWGDHIILTRW